MFESTSPPPPTPSSINLLGWREVRCSQARREGGAIPREARGGEETGRHLLKVLGHQLVAQTSPQDKAAPSVPSGLCPPVQEELGPES